MEFDTTIRENLDGKFVTISASHISDGVEFVKKNKIEQIMVDGEDGIVFDFKKLKKPFRYFKGFIYFIQFRSS